MERLREIDALCQKGRGLADKTLGKDHEYHEFARSRSAITDLFLTLQLFFQRSERFLSL